MESSQSDGTVSEEEVFQNEPTRPSSRQGDAPSEGNVVPQSNGASGAVEQQRREEVPPQEGTVDLAGVEETAATGTSVDNSEQISEGNVVPQSNGASGAVETVDLTGVEETAATGTSVDNSEQISSIGEKRRAPQSQNPSPTNNKRAKLEKSEWPLSYNDFHQLLYYAQDRAKSVHVRRDSLQEAVVSMQKAHAEASFASRPLEDMTADERKMSETLEFQAKQLESYRDQLDDVIAKRKSEAQVALFTEQATKAYSELLHEREKLDEALHGFQLGKIRARDEEASASIQFETGHESGDVGKLSAAELLGTFRSKNAGPIGVPKELSVRQPITCAPIDDEHVERAVAADSDLKRLQLLEDAIVQLLNNRNKYLVQWYTKEGPDDKPFTQTPGSFTRIIRGIDEQIFHTYCQLLRLGAIKPHSMTIAEALLDFICAHMLEEVQNDYTSKFRAAQQMIKKRNVVHLEELIDPPHTVFPPFGDFWYCMRRS